MNDGEFEETRDFWNRVANDWRIQVGVDGDCNRILNSDPVLWKFAGDVSGRTVLDAGCVPDICQESSGTTALVLLALTSPRE